MLIDSSTTAPTFLVMGGELMEEIAKIFLVDEIVFEEEGPEFFLELLLAVEENTELEFVENP